MSTLCYYLAVPENYGFNSGNGCGACYGFYDKTEEIRKAYAAVGRMIPHWWNYEGAFDQIPYYCNRCGKKHRQSWDSFKNGNGCGKCHEKNRPIVAYIYSLETASGWITGKVLAKLGYSNVSKAIAAAAIEIMSQHEIEELHNLLKAKKSTQETDHIVPASYFDYCDSQQIATANSTSNLRNISATANWSRGDRLTTTEILLYFDDPQLRNIYNLASKKPQNRNLPKELPIDQKEWEAWKKKRQKRGIAQRDRKQFEKWHSMWDDRDFDEYVELAA